MKRLLVILGCLLTIGLTHQIEAQLRMPSPEPTAIIEFNPVCRHKAIYWASMIGEEYQTRIVYGQLRGTPHVQPQIKILDTWYYFKIKDEKLVIMTMPPSWIKEYVIPWAEFTLFHNVWMVQKNGRTWHEYNRKEYSKRINAAIKILRNGTR